MDSIPVSHRPPAHLHEEFEELVGAVDVGVGDLGEPAEHAVDGGGHGGPVVGGLAGGQSVAAKLAELVSAQSVIDRQYN